MADTEKEKEKKENPKQEQGKDHIQPDIPMLCGLLRDVLAGQKSMQTVERMINEEVSSLSAEELLVWREKAKPLAQRLMLVAEGISQILVVAASGR